MFARFCGSKNEGSFAERKENNGLAWRIQASYLGDGEAYEANRVNEAFVCPQEHIHGCVQMVLHLYCRSSTFVYPSGDAVVLVSMKKKNSRRVLVH